MTAKITCEEANEAAPKIGEYVARKDLADVDWDTAVLRAIELFRKFHSQQRKTENDR